jgi:P27 family predicted phage terminase small subunit
MANEAGQGRKRKPTVLKGIDGGLAPKKAASGPAEPKPETAKIVRPQMLTPRARVHWDRLAPDLIKQGVLTFWDVNLFAAYCEAAARFDAARTLVTKHGLLVPGRTAGQLVKNPAVQIQRDASDEMMRIGARFGLSPAERAGLQVPNPDKKKTGLAEFR